MHGLRQEDHREDWRKLPFCCAQMSNSPSPSADIQKLLKELEKSKPQPYCIGTVDSFEDIDELRKNPLDDEVLIFPEKDRHFCVELFKGWNAGHEGALPKMLTYIRSLNPLSVPVLVNRAQVAGSCPKSSHDQQTDIDGRGDVDRDHQAVSSRRG